MHDKELEILVDSLIGTVSEQDKRIEVLTRALNAAIENIELRKQLIENQKKIIENLDRQIENLDKQIELLS